MKFLKKFDDITKYEEKIGENIDFSIFPNVSYVEGYSVENIEYNPVIVGKAHYESSGSTVELFRNRYNLKSVRVNGEDLLEQFHLCKKNVSISSEEVLSINNTYKVGLDKLIYTNNLVDYYLETETEILDTDTICMISNDTRYSNNILVDISTVSEAMDYKMSFMSNNRKRIDMSDEYMDALNSFNGGFIHFIIRDGNIIKTNNKAYGSFFDSEQVFVTNGKIVNSLNETLPEEVMYKYIHVETKETINENTRLFYYNNETNQFEQLGAETLGDIISNEIGYFIGNEFYCRLFLGKFNSMTTIYAFSNENDTNGNPILLDTINTYIKTYYQPYKKYEIKLETNEADIEFETFNRFKTNFFGKDLVSIDENSLYYVKEIQSGAFSYCKKLTSIEFSDSLISIGVGAFNNCSSLTYITLGNSVTSIGESAFYNCNKLTSITIPNSVTSIGYSAFNGCTSLASITIPNSVTKIGVSAFNGCTSLTSITIPDSVTSIVSSAFSNCSSLTSITIPNSVTSIGREAFYNCSGLTSINIPNSVTSIGDGAFNNCSSLTSITIPNSVTSIGYQAFSSCIGLTSITIPNSVTSIGDYAFSHCSSLTSIDIPNSVISIGELAFGYCSSLTSVIIPNSVTSIERGAFSDCSGLTSVTLGDSVTSIGDFAFGACVSLTSITIPNSVTEICMQAFIFCTSLTSIICLSTIAPSIENDTFQSIASNGVLHVPSGSDYSSWMSTSKYYLGYYNWTKQEI